MNFIRKNFRLVTFFALGIVLIVTGLSVYEMKSVRFDYNFESFFPSGDPDLATYLKFRKTFGYDNEFMLLAVENKKGIFKKDFLEKIEALTDSLARLPDVTGVKSPSNLQYVAGLQFGSTPYLHPGNPSVYASDSARIYQSPELTGTFFSNDGKAISIYIKNTEGISKKKSDSLLARMTRVIDVFHFDKTHLAGKINGQKIYIDKLEHEFGIFFVCSFFLIALFLFISFRSFWGVWVPMLVVLISIVWILALMTATGKALDIMTVLLPTMMFVVGMSDVVHIVTKYLEELREGVTNRFDALMKTIKDVGFSTFITLLTTSLGFLTLLNSNIIPIRDFGLYTSLGVFVAFILSFTIMPIVLNVIPHPNLKLERKSSSFWNKYLHRLLLWIFRKGKMITAGTIVLILLSGWGITLIKRNNFLVEGLTRKDELRRDFDFFENKFSGVRPFEMLVRPSDSTASLLGVKELRAMDTLENYLQKNYGVGFILSPLTLIKELNKSVNNGDPAFYKLPSDSSAIADLVDQLPQYMKFHDTRELVKTVLTKKRDSCRISGKMHDLGSYVIRRQDAALDSFITATPAMKALHVQVTGAALMLDKNNEYIITNILQDLAFSILAVGLIIGFIHRSWRLAIIAIIPNLLPIIFIGGFMGAFGIALNSTTSIIFSIAFGIATDDTVHFLGRLKFEKLHGKNTLYALKRTYLSTGKAVVVTSLILAAGFMTLIASGFQSTFLFGLLVSVTLLIAVLCDLLLFPLLVIWLVKDGKQ